MRTSLMALVLAAVVTASAGAASSAETVLRVTYWADSAKPGSSVTWTLRCDPPRGDLPRPARACRKLSVGGAKLFTPVPRDAVCTEIYGGPQRARVTGTVDGKRVWATFTRTNGCQIGRWQGLSPWLLPPGGVTG
jgi:hypothetical protein